MNRESAKQCKLEENEFFFFLIKRKNTEELILRKVTHLPCNESKPPFPHTLIFEPSITCFLWYVDETSMCHQREFHACDTFLVKVTQDGVDVMAKHQDGLMSENMLI